MIEEDPGLLELFFIIFEKFWKILVKNLSSDFWNKQFL